MESEAKYILVGAITLVAAGALLVTFLWLAGAQPTEALRTYEIEFREQSLKGLQVGGPINFRGIKVGTVSSIEFDHKNIEVVRVKAELPEDLPLKQGTTASISRSLVTGLATIDLIGGDPNGPRAGKKIPEGKSDLQELASSIPELLDEANNVVAGLDRFLSKENADNFSKTLSDFQKLTAEVSEKREEMASLIENFHEASKSISKTSENVESVSTDVRQAIEKVSSSFKTSMEEVSEMLSDVQLEIREISAKVSGGVELITQSAVNVGSSAREVSKSLNTTLKEYEEPKEILFGADEDALGPGE